MSEEFNRTDSFIWAAPKLSLGLQISFVLCLGSAVYMRSLRRVDKFLTCLIKKPGRDFRAPAFLIPVRD